ncbi:hypothetical protein DSO57_1038433 [Entomophthora muscae]|uniref:Uncharacterized protein n=2 Tax=Entomophthora muscae TaxID=34485 RepID=A0ACC2TBX2_9FUNG|nr:hypothetical protein DSO57_1030769 [Entomophthora muscae]KAJ9083062.1 hypothetical protein DSO57_1038433 [Entomophthora muscae]
MLFTPLVLSSLTALVLSAPSSNARPAGSASRSGNPGKSFALQRRCGGFGNCGGFGGCGGFGDFGGCGGCGDFGGCGFGNGGGFGGCGGFGPTIIDDTCCSNQECFHDTCCDSNTEAAAFCNNESFNEVDANCCNDFNQNTFIC